MKRLCLLACLGAQAALASGLDDYANVMPILTSGESAAWQVDLDFSVYAGSIDPDLRDLAVFNADGQPVPMRMVAVAAPASLLEEQAGVALLALPADGDERARGDNLRLLVERDAEGRLRRLETQSSADTGVDAEPAARVWLLDLAGFKRGIDHLALDWDAPRDGVIAHFEVSASSDLQRWEMLNADATVVLLAQDATRIERRAIDLAATTLRYLRLRRTDAGAPLTGLRAEAGKTRRVAGATPLQWVEAAAVAESGEFRASSTRHLYAVHPAVPASHIKLNLGSDNALAEVEIFSQASGQAGPARWIRRASGVAFRLAEGGDVIDNDAFLLGQGPRIAALRIDSATPLLPSPRVVVGFQPARVVFLAEGKPPYSLAVGSATARYPDYPIDAALATLRARFGRDWQPPVAELGDSRAQSGDAALRAPEAPFDWKRGLLWVVLIGAAVVVASIAISLLRHGGERGHVDREKPPEE